MFHVMAMVCLHASTVWCTSGEESHRGLEGVQEFSNEWTARILGGADVAQLVALQSGYEFVGEVRGFPDIYLLRKDKHELRRRNPSHHLTRQLRADPRVEWADQLFDKTRVKRHVIPESERTLHRVKRIEESAGTIDVGNFVNDNKLKKEKENSQWAGIQGVTSHEDSRRKRSLQSSQALFNDELWGQEWYLRDTRTRADLPRLDLNVLPVYQAGINGEGVRVTVLDDGLEHQHSDLRDNYDPEISWDCNDGDPDPTPRNDERRLNSHGTRCAGEIGMVANNGKCGVGVAWGARVGGVRMLDGRVNDRVEGEALGFAWDKVDIYSASWGPNDDGRTVEGPGRLAQHALERGVTEGRNGKGVIYVWANGNGGSRYDNCNCDGYSSSVYTVSIGSASQQGRFPWYGETCSSTLAAAYSSGAYGDQKIATTDIGDSCTLKHTGTSAAAPLAAGIIALTLQANPRLNWRDVQHLLVWTSEQAPLAANSGWQTNSAGLRFDVRFGFGVLNAAAMVTEALNWTAVPEKHICRVDNMPLSNSSIAYGASVQVLFPASECTVEYLEHVELVTSVRYTMRGALQVHLTSPQGTTVELLSRRPLDKSTSGFVNWPLTSVGTWGERPRGIWTAVVEDKVNEGHSGSVGPFTLVLHGTADMPNHMKNGPRAYNDHYMNDNGKYEINTFMEASNNMNSIKANNNDKHVEELNIFGLNKADTQNNNDVVSQNQFDKYPAVAGLEGFLDKEDMLQSADDPLLAEFEKVLLRVNHRMLKLSENVN